MKKTLIITNKYPLPEDTGTNIRTMNFARYFKSMGIVDIAHRDLLRDDSDNDFFHSNLQLVLNSGSRGLLKRLHNLISITPNGIYNYSTLSKQELLSRIIKEQYDYILVRYATNTATLFDLPVEYRKRIIVDVDDLPSDIHAIRKKIKSRGLLSRIKINLNSFLLKQYEKKCLKFGAILFCSAIDKEKVTTGINKGKTYIIPNIIPDTSFKGYDFSQGYNNLNKLLFVGTLNYPPNHEGLDWFIHSIFPMLKKKNSNVTLDIVGRSPRPSLVNLCESQPDITLHPNVPDIKKYYKQCGVVIVPLLSGGGTRIKILEAALTQRPVISTPLGAYGLDVENNKNIMLFSDSSEFIRSYQMLQDQSFYDSIVHDLEKTVNDHYSVYAFNKSMNSVITDLGT